MDYVAMDPRLHNHIKIVFVGAPGADKADFMQSAVFADPSHYQYRTARVQVIVSNYVHMDRQYLLEVCNVEGAMDDLEAAKVLGDAHVVVLVYDHHRHQPTLDVLSQVWVPRVATCVKTTATCFMVSTRNIGVKTRVVSFPLCTDEERVLLSLPPSRQFARTFETEGHVGDDVLARRLVETAVRNHEDERKRNTCCVL